LGRFYSKEKNPVFLIIYALKASSFFDPGTTFDWHLNIPGMHLLTGFSSSLPGLVDFSW
jgi:hypothetical protein